ncbi:unnamed protein product, partial [Symbiodinium sp. KB8]
MTPLQELQLMFKDIPDMEVDGAPKRGAEEENSLSKYPRPSSKGQGMGKGPASSSMEAPTPGEGNNPPTSQGSQDKQEQSARPNQQKDRDQGWGRGQSWGGWHSKEWSSTSAAENNRLEDLEEKMRLLARVALRHEDELSQMRTERVFVLTFETKQGSVLNRLYELAVIWHEKKEKEEVNSPLRLMLFMGLLEHWKLRLRALESDQSLRDLMVERGLATLEEGIPELKWGYQKWNSTLEKLEAVPDAEPMLQSQVVETLIQLEATIQAPNALVQFHATRKLTENLEGDTITFLMGVGLRDPMASQAWGMMTNLCGLSAGRLIGLRIKPARMDRQPIAKVLAEKFPPQKGKGKGRGRRGQYRRAGWASPLDFDWSIAAISAISMLLAICCTGCGRCLELIKPMVPFGELCLASAHQAGSMFLRIFLGQLCYSIGRTCTHSRMLQNLWPFFSDLQCLQPIKGAGSHVTVMDSGTLATPLQFALVALSKNTAMPLLPRYPPAACKPTVFWPEVGSPVGSAAAAVAVHYRADCAK